MFSEQSPDYINRRRPHHRQLRKMAQRCWLLWLLLHVLGHILLVVNQVGSSPADKTIHIGFLLQFMDTGGAINVAIEQAQNNSLLLDYNFRYSC